MYETAGRVIGDVQKAAHHGGLDHAPERAFNRTETVLEGVVSCLSHSLSRIHNSAERAAAVSNKIVGFADGAEKVLGTPAAVPTSVADYLAEIDAALFRLEQNLGRLD